MYTNTVLSIHMCIRMLRFSFNVCCIKIFIIFARCSYEFFYGHGFHFGIYILILFLVHVSNVVMCNIVVLRIGMIYLIVLNLALNCP